jgi:hypothetical protein
MVSPILSRRNIVHQKQPQTNKFDDDQIFAELKPVKFDGLYKKEMTQEEIIESINRLTNSNKENVPQGDGKKVRKGITRNINNDVNDNAYPFKQDKLTCSIF